MMPAGCSAAPGPPQCGPAQKRQEPMGGMMRALLMMLFAVLVAPLALASAAHAQTVYVALYVEAAPNATGFDFLTD